MGYVAVGSNVDSGDWDAQTTADTLCENLLTGARQQNPAVALLHSWPSATAPGLQCALARLKDAGATFVTVAELTQPELAACDPLAPTSIAAS
jgi:hypothetical protein